MGNEKAAGSSLSHAVLWEHGRAFDLNALVRAADALQPHVTLFSAFRVNEWGRFWWLRGTIGSATAMSFTCSLRYSSGVEREMRDRGATR